MNTEALATSLNSGLRAVRDEVNTARRIVRENLNDASIGLASLGLHEAGSKLQHNLEEASSKLQHTLGVGSSNANATSVCDACAAPFVHGPALQAEINKLQLALDHSPEEGVLRAAHESLKQLDNELHLVTTSAVSPLTALADPPAAEKSSRAAAAVAALLEREAGDDAARAEAERAATARVTADREAWLARLAQQANAPSAHGVGAAPPAAPAASPPGTAVPRASTRTSTSVTGST